MIDLLERIGKWLVAVRAGIRKIHNALENHSESGHIPEEVERREDFPRQPIRAVVSFDDETIRRTQAEGGHQQNTQDSIKNATWAAVVAAGIYPLISILIWCQMIKQNKIANAQLRQSTESFRMDERAWIEIQPIALPSNPAARYGAFRYELYPKNIGKTAASNIKIQALRGSMSNSISMGDHASQVSLLQDKMLVENGALSNVPRVNPTSKYRRNGSVRNGWPTTSNLS